MIFRATRVAGLAVICFGVATAMLLLANGRPDSELSRIPLVQDWTHRHMVYSHPQSIIQNLQLQRQDRYVEQVLHRNYASTFPKAEPSNRWRPTPTPKPIKFGLPDEQDQLHRDWGVVLPAANETMGDGNFPAKYSFDINSAPDCTHDFIVFTQTTANAGGGAVTIYALNNLYTGTCKTGSVPNVLWAYTFYSNSGGAVVGSPILSLDGTQVAWIESKGSGTAATLHILKPYTGGSAGTLGAPEAPANSGSASAFRSCTPSAGNGACLYSIAFNNGDDDTTSSPYIDYGFDEIFVGDADGDLHLFTGVFSGSPVEAHGGSTGWPVSINGNALTSPVFDENSSRVFVGDSGGRLSYVSVSSGGVGALGGTSWNLGAGGISNDGPIVDGSTGRVFVFANLTGTGAVVGEADTSLGTHTGPVTVGSSTASPFHSGQFDNLYYNSDTGAGTGTGFLYVCGNSGTGSPANRAVLYQIPVTNGTIGTTATSEFTATTAGSECSPVTEFYNPSTTTDLLFFGVQASGNASTDCSGLGCVFVAELSGDESVTIPGAIPVSGGSSGIIVDNDSSSAGGSNVYYSALGNSSSTYPCGSDTSDKACAIQVGQLGLGSAGVFVQGNSGDNGAATSETSFLSTGVKAGDLVLVWSKWDAPKGTTITATGATDNRGNTYTALGPAIPIGTDGAGDPNWVQAWYAKNVSGAPTGFTVSYSGKTFDISLVDAAEYSGLDKSDPLDSASYMTNTGEGQSLTTGPSGTTTANDETIIGIFGTLGAEYPFTAGSGFSINVIDASSLIEDENVSITGSYTATATGNSGTSTTPWGAIIVGFRNAIQ